MRLNRVAAALALVLVLTAVMLGVSSAVDRGEETAAVPSQAGYYAGADETVAYGSLQAAYDANPTFTSFTAYNTDGTVGNINGADGIATGLTLTVYGTLTLDPGTTSFTTITVEAGAKLTSSGFTATNLTVGAGATFTVTGTLIFTGTATSLNAAADSTVSIGTLSLGTSASTVSMNFNNGGSAYSPTKNYATVNTLSLDSGGGSYTISLTGLAEVNNIGMGSNIYTYLYINSADTDKKAGLIIGANGTSTVTGAKNSGTLVQSFCSMGDGANLYLAGTVQFDLFFMTAVASSLNAVIAADTDLTFSNATGEFNTSYPTYTQYQVFNTLTFGTAHTLTVHRDLFVQKIVTDDADGIATIRTDGTAAVYTSLIAGGTLDLNFGLPCIITHRTYYDTHLSASSKADGQIIFESLTDWAGGNSDFLTLSGNITAVSYHSEPAGVELGSTDLNSSIRIDNVTDATGNTGNLSIKTLNKTKLTVGSASGLSFEDTDDGTLQTGSSLTARIISIAAPHADNKKLLIENGCTITAESMETAGTVQVGDPAEAGTDYTRIDLYGLDGEWLNVSDTLTLWCVLNLNNGGTPSAGDGRICFNYRMDGKINTITTDGTAEEDYALDPYPTIESVDGRLVDYTDPVAVYCGLANDLPNTPAIFFDIPAGEGEFVGWSYNGTTYEYQDIDAGWGTFHSILGVKASYAVPLEFVSVWEVTDHTVTAAAGAGGSIDPAGATEVKDGGSLTVTFTADSGYRIAGVTVDGKTVDSYNNRASGSYTFTNVTADCSISVTFTNTILISVNSSAGGTVSPSDTLVAPGSDLTLTFTAADLYALGDVSVDGVSVGTPDSYTFTDITAPHYVYVSFIITLYTVSYNVTCNSDFNAVIFSPEQRLVQQNMPFTVQMKTAPGYTIAAIAVNGTTYKTFSEKTTEVTFTLAHVVADTQIYVTAVPITNVYITPYSYDVTVTGGSSVQVGTIVWNANEGNPVRVKMDSISLLSDENQEVTFRVTSNNTQWSAGYESVVDKDSVEFLVDLAASEYSSGGYAKLLLNFVVTENPGADAEIAGQAIMQAVVINITIIPAVSTVEGYGLLFGQFESPFGPSLDDPALMAALSLLLLLILLFIVLYEVYPRLKRQMERHRVPLATKSRIKSAVGLLIVIYLIYTVHLCIYINGASFRFLAYASMACNALYVLLAAGLIMLLVEEVRVRALKKYAADDSLLPLAFSLTKIVIVIGAVALACRALGTDLAYIVATLGILTTALGFGFKSTLTKILDGLIMNANRNFNTGDIIRIGRSEQVLRIVHIGIMTTTLTDWLNPSEKYMMPNDRLETAQVVNMTRGGNDYRVSIAVDVAHGADLRRMKEILLQVAAENEHVVKDGSVPLPDVMVMALGASAVQLRLRAYVDDKETYPNLAAQLRERINELVSDGTIDMPYDQLTVSIGRAVTEENGRDKTGTAADSRNMGVKE